jgi:hypothetical protein
VTEGLPPMIPLPLLLGESKFKNPQVRTWTAARVYPLVPGAPS